MRRRLLSQHTRPIASSLLSRRSTRRLSAAPAPLNMVLAPLPFRFPGLPRRSSPFRLRPLRENRYVLSGRTVAPLLRRSSRRSRVDANPCDPLPLLWLMPGWKRLRNMFHPRPWRIVPRRRLPRLRRSRRDSSHRLLFRRQSLQCLQSLERIRRCRRALHSTRLLPPLRPRHDRLLRFIHPGRNRARIPPISLLLKRQPTGPQSRLRPGRLPLRPIRPPRRMRPMTCPTARHRGWEG